MKKHIPNILTLARLVLTLVMFAALVMMVGARSTPAAAADLQGLSLVAFVTFVAAALTDFFDGWLARRWNVVSMTGAILDPIADKVLVCGAILGLLGFGAPGVLIPGALILFREFSVSALREVLAPKGIKLPVTFLAKTKTALQLLSLAVFLGFIAWAASTGGPDPVLFDRFLMTAIGLFWASALVTVWTGVEYALAARKALAAAP